MLQGLLALLREAPGYNQVGDALQRGAESPSVLGPGGTAAACLIAAIATDSNVAARPILIITPTQDMAERLADDLRTVLAGSGLSVVLYPEVPAGVPADGGSTLAEHTGAPGVRAADPAGQAADPAGRAAGVAAASERLRILEALAGGEPVIAVASAAAAVDPLPAPEALKAATRDRKSVV